uniref:Transmembrane protein n=1 Tax=Eustigmatophyceae sp. Mont 10/10-1w TaxID=2506145 RepID=A0A451FMS2_9STRA|nr:hypothetical protein Ycf60 [Eustigmatophyceae sp. Mont 10/10-1w]QAA11714.1 hypothetical protein Ycf60 [Eustigmatophyceae sp. Mont 10/10-1w]
MTLFKSPNLISNIKTKKKLLIRINYFKLLKNNFEINKTLSFTKNSINRNKLSFNKLTLLAVYFSYRFNYLQQKKIKSQILLSYFSRIKKKLKSISYNSTYLQYKISIKQYLLVYLKLLKRLILNSIKTRLEFRQNKNKFNDQIKFLFKYLQSNLNSLYKKLLQNVRGFSFDKSSIKNFLYEYSKRIILVTLLYAAPFFALLNHALVCFIPIGDNVIINRSLLGIFGKIPYLLTVFKRVFGIVDSDSKFWILYIYYLIFPSGYQALKIPYEIAYNGTVAFSFFSFQFALELIQEYLVLPFDMYLGFTQWLYNHKFDTKIGPPFRTLYAQLYDEILMTNCSNLIQKFEDLLFVISQSIVSPLIFVTLCALVYNCVYYVLKKKNPQILLISKTVARTMVDSKDDLF